MGTRSNTLGYDHYHCDICLNLALPNGKNILNLILIGCTQNQSNSINHYILSKTSSSKMNCNRSFLKGELSLLTSDFDSILYPKSRPFSLV